jgi:hypothetical protein
MHVDRSRQTHKGANDTFLTIQRGQGRAYAAQRLRPRLGRSAAGQILAPTEPLALDVAPPASSRKRQAKSRTARDLQRLPGPMNGQWPTLEQASGGFHGRR